MKKKGRLGSIILLCFSGAVCAGAIAVFFLTRPQPVDKSGCRQDGILEAHTVLLIDQSDPFTENDVRWLKRELADAVRKLPQYGRVTLLGLRSSTPYEPEEVFSRCSPGSPEAANQIFQNKSLIESVWRQDLVEPLSAAGDQLLLVTVQPDSPIVESLIGISQRPDFGAEVDAREIIIVSDFVQNSKAYSHFNGGPKWQNLLASSLKSELPQLENVRLVFDLVPRREGPNRMPQDKLAAFWTEFASATGAKEEFKRTAARADEE